jgi:hypothetical protein
MRILYVNGFRDFAQATYSLLNEKHLAPHWTIERAETCVDALELLRNKSFDLVISTLVYPGIPDHAGKASRSGGADLYKYILEKNETISVEEKIAFCFLTRSEPHLVLEVLERKITERYVEPPVYTKGTPLHAIIEDFEKEKRAAKPAATRPVRKKTAEGKNIPSAVVKKHRL